MASGSSVLDEIEQRVSAMEAALQAPENSSHAFEPRGIVAAVATFPRRKPLSSVLQEAVGAFQKLSASHPLIADYLKTGATFNG